MKMRRRFKQAHCLSDRLKIFSDQLKAVELQAGPEKNALLKRAQIAGTASDVDQRANAPGLRPPE